MSEIDINNSDHSNNDGEDYDYDEEEDEEEEDYVTADDGAGDLHDDNDEDAEKSQYIELEANSSQQNSDSCMKVNKWIAVLINCWCTLHLRTSSICNLHTAGINNVCFKKL